jgi:hypothetical protein
VTCVIGPKPKQLVVSDAATVAGNSAMTVSTKKLVGINKEIKWFGKI